MFCDGKTKLRLISIAGLAFSSFLAILTHIQTSNVIMPQFLGDRAITPNLCCNHALTPNNRQKLPISSSRHPCGG